MRKESIVAFDTAATKWLQRGPKWLAAPMNAASTIGQPVTLFVIAAVVAAAAWQLQAPVVGAIVAALGAMIANSLLKHFVHRTRPDTLYVSNMYFKTSSFPSGHAFGSMVVLGLIAYIAMRYLAMPLHILAPGFLGLLIASIGVSRVYVGAHFPTDVIAGWLLGILVLIAIIFGFGL